MKKHDVIEAVIEEVKFPNKGIAFVEDRKIIIKNTLKNQRVKARITKKKNKKIKAKVLEVLEKSPLEKEADCKHFNECGGCSYQNLPYKEQLNMKKEQVKKLFKNAGIEEYEFLGIESSPKEFDYRNKMEFTFGDVEKDGPLALGMHKKNRFYEMETVTGCNIADDDFTDILSIVLEYFREKEVPFYHKKTHKGVLRHLVVRKAEKTGEVLINLVTSSQKKLDLDDLVERIKNKELKGKLVGFLHTINDNVADIVQSDETKVIYGRDYITEKILGLEFKITAFSFFQTNSSGAEKLYNIARDFAQSDKSKTVFDLYCGTGTIAQIMSPISKKVIGIEIVEEAIEAAKKNAELNNLNNCEFVAGDVLEKVDEIKVKPDIIILDPPRMGIHKKAIEKIINFNAKEIVYVSCKPTSLVSDLEKFIERGYEVKKVKCMDMFPHTPHVETVVLIEKK
ncbi:MAG: 23S rRNA (uracil(1939)-C(5))-methyltransferase RlmD [Firmicutes bacterium]|nr:23S rRNA (uracil(1939)-C(5))-methyltransferase RlmD [Bacillota bacterium]